MNDFMNNPFMQNMQQEEDRYLTEVHPLAKLWALRILVELGGAKEFINDNCFSHQWIAKHLGFSEDLLGEQFNSQRAHQELAQLHQMAEIVQVQNPAQFSAELSYNLKLLQRLLGLNEVECLILGFVVLVHSEQLLDDIADHLGTLTAAKSMKALAIILAIPYEDVRQALAVQGCLHRSGLIHLQREYSSYLRSKLDLVSAQLVDKLLVKANDVMDLFVGTINKSAAAELTLEDYPHLQSQLDLLLAYLQQVKQQAQVGVNIFIYGSSGTGKTQLCKVLAEALQVQLFEIACEDEDGDAITATGRLCAYRAAQSVFDGQTALLLFDEVEDVFNDTEKGAGMKSTAQSRKAWVNRILEQNRTPAIWVSNSDQIDPAFLRRFDLILEVTIPPKQQRMKMIEQYCGDQLSEQHQQALANAAHLSPALLRRAYRVAKTAKRANQSLQVQNTMLQLVSNTLVAQGHHRIKLYDSAGLPKFYDLDYINTKANMMQIAAGIKQHGFGRLCLYGASGTGKTAFARWLADHIGQPLLIKRGSDLQSPYIGEMEQNLAKAFAEAEEQKAVLLLDEVDSLLQDRRNAVRSWEIAQVNEFLVQMESFNGIVITTTNRFDDLDQAALRRFDFKIHFDYLTYAQRLQLFKQVCQQLNIEINEQQISAKLKQLNRLCAGDFAVIIRQARFHPFQHVDEILQHLNAEMAVKYQVSQTIGFAASA